jgi:hypothetical protein
MQKITLLDPDTNDTLIDICMHNLREADKHHSYRVFAAAAKSWLSLHPDKNFQDMERMLRANKMDTHLIACRRPEGPLVSYKLGPTDVKKRIYECIFCCRPEKDALAELAEYWESYEENFGRLEYTGFMVSKNTFPADSVMLNETESDVYNQICKTLKKAQIVVL